MVLSILPGVKVSMLACPCHHLVRRGLHTDMDVWFKIEVLLVALLLCGCKEFFAIQYLVTLKHILIGVMPMHFLELSSRVKEQLFWVYLITVLE